MTTRYGRLLFSLFIFPVCLCAQAGATKAASDPLSRTNPRSAVTAFLQACQRDNYALASQYLDLRHLSERSRRTEGIELAKQLEAILNSDSHFLVLRLSQAPEGDPSDDPNPLIETIASVPREGKIVPIDLERTEAAAGPQIWLFSASTVAEIPSLTPRDTTSWIEARLPKFFGSIDFLDTALWKWIALLLIVVAILLVFRLAERLTLLLVKALEGHSRLVRQRVWIQPLLQPWLVFLSALVFSLGEQFVNPSALSRLYIGRAILMVVVWAFAWCLINVVELFLTRIDSLLEPRQRMVSHSMIYMGKRAAKVAIFAIAMIIILDNWGYNMTTMIAGLGVGGIAVALAAQGTIANVFGGVSVIADHPIMVGDFGNFGGVLGQVEDIGLRSTRVRTLNRTVMSIPNSSFAGMNLENYALRDKILFNPTLQVKRGTPKEKILKLMEAIEEMLRARKDIEVGSTPVRLTNLTAGTIPLEIFAYALTEDIDHYYKIQADLFLELDATFAGMQVELA